MAATNTAIAIRDDQVVFDDHQRQALVHLGVDNANNGDLAVFFHTCKRTGLDPFARQIYMIKRDGKQTIQVGIGGLQLVAQRTTERTGGSLGYEETLWADEDGDWHDVWISAAPPAAAKVVILKDGQRFPFIAHFAEYVQTYWDKKTEQRRVTKTWDEKPAHMLAKCAEAGALRKAFPQDLSGLYITEEATASEVVQSEVVAESAPVTAADFREDVVDGTVEPDEPPAETSADMGELMSRDQVAEMDRLFVEAGMPGGRAVANRKARADYVSKVLEVEISPGAPLTAWQASRVIEALIADLEAAEQARGGE